MINTPHFKKEPLNIRIVINTFTGNSQESNQTEELLLLIRQKNLKICEILDVNQELVFEKEKSNY